MKIVFYLLVLGFASAGHLPGAAADSSAGRPLPIAEPGVAAARASVERAKIAAQNGNASVAEHELIPLNRAKPNTSAWHMETAQRLMQIAEQLARESQPGSVPALAARALAQLDQAVAATKDARQQAAATTLAGFIYERYLADPAAALASYRAAAQVSPVTAKRAQEAVDRLQRSDDNLREKIAAAGK